MPILVKSHLQRIEAERAPSAYFTEWAYEDAKPGLGEEAVWFTAETSGGFGLYAIGRIASESVEAGKNAKGNRLISVRAEFFAFEPRQPLGKADFASLPRVGKGSPIQDLNRRLYLNSHVKIAEIDDETFRFVASRF